VEFSSDGVACFSYLDLTYRGLSHTVVDIGELDLHLGVPPTPGAFAPSGSQASVAEALADAARITRWEYDMSSAAADSGTGTWLSHRTITEMLVHLMRILTPFCPDRWAGLDTSAVEDDDPDSLILPGVCHVLRFRVLPVLMPAQLILLERARRQLASLGCGLVHKESNDSVLLTVPPALEAGKNMDLAVYSSDSGFLRVCEEVLPSVAENWHLAESPAELAGIQDRAMAMVLRLKPAELPLAAAFAARLPSQPLLVVTGTRTGIPLLGSSVELLQLPVEEKLLLVALRKLLRK
jgi:hypothetical protein